MSPSASQRAALNHVTTTAETRLAQAWRVLPVADVSAMIDGLDDLLPAVGDEYGNAAAALAADYYDQARDIHGAGGRFEAEPADVVDLERWRSLARWGVKPLYGADPRPTDALTLIQGGVQRSVANQYRDTITVASTRDKAAKGWRRVGHGGCDLCRLILSRGAVYTEASAQFETHDHCSCSCEPAFH